MLTISNRLRDGLAFMTVLAKYYDTGKLMPLRAVEKWAGIPVGYMEEIVVALKQANLIQGSRGSGGGYRLRRQPSKIRVQAIIQALTDSLEFIREDDKRRQERLAYSQKFWKILEKEIIKILREHTLEDLLH